MSDTKRLLEEGLVQLLTTMKLPKFEEPPSRVTRPADRIAYQDPVFLGNQQYVDSEPWIPREGDVVRVIRNSSGAHLPGEGQRPLLKPGDEIVIKVVHRNGELAYRVQPGWLNYIPLEDVQFVRRGEDPKESGLTHKCTCDTVVLLRDGCQCGGS